MDPSKQLSRRDLLAAASAAGLAAGMGVKKAPAADDASQNDAMPVGQIGNVRISRLLLGGNLISGWMHSRDLKYVNSLFRAYATEEKILETLSIAEKHGINTVFESGAAFVERYNRECGGKMQFIPHIKVETTQSEADLTAHIQAQVDSGAAALYIWGVSGDTLIRAGEVGRLAKAVELAKKHNLPVGVGGHSLQVPMECEKHGVPCDFYVKTFHQDDYDSATPKPLRKDFMWLPSPEGQPEGWYDNMWCIDPVETAQFMRTVGKPWLAFKVLAAGAYYPRDGFSFAFDNGADFIAVGMLDFQIKANSELMPKVVRRAQDRPRPWRA